MRRKRPLITFAPRLSARFRRKSSITSRRHMPMYSRSDSVLPTSTARFDGEIIFILVTLRSMISSGRSNSPTMHSGMAPPQGLQLSSLRSIIYVSIPAFASVSAAHAPEGPPPTTATFSRLSPSNRLPAARARTARPRPLRRPPAAAVAARTLVAPAISFLLLLPLLLLLLLLFLAAAFDRYPHSL